jgi:ATP-dependent helicase/nuclease subunit A
MTALSAQLRASDPAASVFVTANAGSGKTKTLVDRVARLLLQGVQPHAILCVTYTKAAAAEMQTRLFKTLGDWAVMPDAPLAKCLVDIDERPQDLPRARRLFARALETPGGLKIQTIHAFCEKLLRRFPLEAGVSPRFRVLEDQAARQVSAKAREDVALFALEDPDGPVGQAYDRFAVDLDFRAFNDMFQVFEARRDAITRYAEALGERGLDVIEDVWRRCGFDAPDSAEGLRARAVSPPALDIALWRAGARALAASGVARDQKCANQMGEVAEAALAGQADFDAAISVFCTAKGEAAKWVETAASLKADPDLHERLIAERERLIATRDRAKAAKVAEDTVAALTLARVYANVYEAEKHRHGGLDFTDLIDRTWRLLTERADAAWVLFKLDWGVDHILVDEAQDTAPGQWAIVRALAEEFFAGAGARDLERTVFAVGDEKQSIFSFQGAAPEQLQEETGFYRGLVEATGRTFEGVELLESWRSTPEVLQAVDAVFAPAEVLAGLRPAAEGAAEPIEHRPLRPKGHGGVELWPLEESAAAPEVDVWAPVDAEPSDSANKRLARRIARDIRARVDGCEAIFARGPDGREAARPAGFGDFLILVRRRNALFHEIVRALKAEKVEVGGADRLVLSDHIVFHDLLALARFVLFPDDDLNLAGLLRSPLFDGFSDPADESLFDLAYDRGRASIWLRLRTRAAERPQWAAALDFLEWARAEAVRRAPFDFFGHLLSRLDGEGRSMRARILRRLGREADDALDAFLGEAMAAERRGARDLESFAAELAASDIEVKREQEEGKGYVRVMTVHGAKGLEAPIVYLPDTATKAQSRGSPLLETADGGFLWCARKAEDSAATAAARTRRDEASDHESLRLLYVALTRARDRLVVCGVMPGLDHLRRGSWYELVEHAFQTVLPDVREDTDGDRTVLRFGAGPVRAPAALAGAAGEAPAPAWLSRPAPAEPASLSYASPSRMADQAKGPAPSPLAEVQGLGRFRRGDLVHRLLQLLPDLPPAARADAALSLLMRERDLTQDQQEEMAQAALGVLNDARFAEVFGPGSRAEVAIAGSAPGLPEGLAISGRIDRLVILPDRVLVVDYKTNRPAPGRIEDADDAYVVQMAVYAAVLGGVFPGRRIEAALVWTDGPRLMAVPDDVMAAALARLRSRH